MPVALWLWRLLVRPLAPFLAQRLIARRREAGVSEARLKELRGIPSRARPEGGLVWLHAVSVGESLSILPLMDALHKARPDLTFLVTTMTPASAEIMGARLPGYALHQFAPVDALRYLRQFLDHWRPDLLIVVENDLWPLMLEEAKRRRIPRARVNARLSAQTARHFQRMPATARALTGYLDLTTVQNAETKTALARLGARNLMLSGDMKASAAAPPADPVMLARLRAEVGGRPVWAAISTHEGEEELVLAAHEAVRAQFPDALLILCPRHPDRAGQITALASMTRRSQGEGPGGAVWLVDTLGETGLWYRLAPVSFIGGSLVPVGGHNPWEGARVGTALLHGPEVANAAAAWGVLDAAGGAREIGADLGAVVAGLLADPSLVRAMAQAAQAVAEAQEQATGQVAEALLALIRDQE